MGARADARRRDEKPGRRGREDATASPGRSLPDRGSLDLGSGRSRPSVLVAEPVVSHAGAEVVADLELHTVHLEADAVLGERRLVAGEVCVLDTSPHRSSLVGEEEPGEVADLINPRFVDRSQALDESGRHVLRLRRRILR